MTAERRRTLAAAMDRILPPDGGPGASDAHAIGYVDWLIGQIFFRRAARELDAGLDLLDSLAAALWKKEFAACDAVERDAILAEVQRVPHPVAQRFFRMLVHMTLAGFLCSPEYGGNRGCVGWRFIGFTPHPVTWTPSGEGREP